MYWDHEPFLRKSGIGLPLSPYFVAFANQTHGSCKDFLKHATGCCV